MLHWTKSGPEENFIVDSNVQTAFLELSLHDRGTYNVFVSKILGAIDKTSVSLPDSTSYLVNHMRVSGLDSHY